MDKPPDFDPRSAEGRLFAMAKRLQNRSESKQDQQDDNDDSCPNERSAPDPHGDVPVSGPTVLEKAMVVIVSTLIASGIVGITTISVSTARKVDVLIDRPESVPRWQYENDIRQMKEDLRDTKIRVDRIEQRQAEGIARRNER